MTHVLIDRATLEQLVAALEMPCDRWSTVQFEIAADAIKAGRAALANAEPAINVRTVTVSKFGVSFGNTTVSHERITGRNAEALNEGSGGVVSNEYMKWLNLPKDTL